MRSGSPIPPILLQEDGGNEGDLDVGAEDKSLNFFQLFIMQTIASRCKMRGTKK